MPVGGLVHPSDGPGPPHIDNKRASTLVTIGGSPKASNKRAQKGSKQSFSPCVYPEWRGDALDTPNGRSDRWFWVRRPPKTTPGRQVTP